MKTSQYLYTHNIGSYILYKLGKWFITYFFKEHVKTSENGSA